jgi:teichoic acid transport system ATP-binding protein
MVSTTEPLLRLSSRGENKLPLLQAKNLGIKYEGERKNDFKSLVHDLFAGERQKANNEFWALQDLSFKGYAGDVLGVIGSNGAGKSTLCRTISGILRPNTGSIKVRGQVSSLLSLGTGFNMELSGRENIILNGMMLGFSRKQLKEIQPDIEGFSGLGRFLDYPLKYYSSGMKARLGFSIAAAMETEILVIDEVLSTGDMSFSRKAVARMKELVTEAKMVVVVTHDTDFVEKNCNRVIWLDKGRIAAQGEPVKVLELYKESAAGRSRPTKKKIISFKKTRTAVGVDNSIKVENLGICFQLGRKPFWALKEVNLTVREKEIVGIVGHNGAGKSTLCRTLAGLYQPDQGKIRVNGEITSLLSLGAGFNSQLSGRDNIYLNGMMMGIPKKVLQELEEEIIDFAELDDFIHKPIKEYSKGMKSRLGFSIAAVIQPDIFLVDEALSTGDIAFRAKAAVRMQEMLEEAKTVILVTHNMKMVEKLCTRVVWLHEGKVRFDGEPRKAVELYRESVREKKKGLV